MTTTILVTDAEQRAALAAVRSLGARGYKVIVCSTSPHPLAASSRHAAAVERVPDPLRTPVAFVDRLIELVHARAIDVVLPISEPSLIPILEHRSRLAPAVVPFPSLDRFLALSDKAGLTERAPALGIAIPKQLRIDRPGQVPEAAVEFPLVVKPARSVAGVGASRVKLTVRHAAGIHELRRILESLPHDAYPVLLQQQIIGPGVGIFLLRWDGRTLAAMAHRRIREKPPAGGVSVFRETIAAPVDLVARSESLLEAYEWSGVAMVEYKLDALTGTPYLMEVNGRLWGSLQLAIDAGVDFPALLVAAALGQPVEPVTEYRLVRSRWWWGEVDHLIARWRHHGPVDAHLPGRLRTTCDVLRPWHARCREEVFRWDDPRPFLRETRDWFRALAG